MSGCEHVLANSLNSGRWSQLPGALIPAGLAKGMWIHSNYPPKVNQPKRKSHGAFDAFGCCLHRSAQEGWQLAGKAGKAGKAWARFWLRLLGLFPLAIADESTPGAHWPASIIGSASQGGLFSGVLRRAKRLAPFAPPSACDAVPAPWPNKASLEMQNIAKQPAENVFLPCFELRGFPLFSSSTSPKLFRPFSCPDFQRLSNRCTK